MRSAAWLPSRRIRSGCTSIADAAAGLQRWVEADSLLSALDPDAGWMRDWVNYWATLADVRYYAGRHDDELVAARRGNARFGGNVETTRREARALAALGRDSDALAVVDDALGRTPPDLDSEGLLRIVSAARVHGHLALARAVAERALRAPIVGLRIGDSTVTRARYEVLILEAAEMWPDAIRSARRLLRADSIAGRRDALPYMVLLQDALHRGALADAAGLETRARAEAAVRRKFDGKDEWISESPQAVEVALAALRRDPRRTATLSTDVVDHGLWNYYSYSERAALDGVRADPSLALLLHNPAADHRPTPRRDAGVATGTHG